MKKVRKKASLGDDLVQSMREALAHARGKKTGAREHHFDAAIRVKRIRKKVGMTQEKFASALGVSISGLRKWEQGQRQPHGAARTLLNVMDRAPKAVVKALS